MKNIAREIKTFWGTDTDTYYLDSNDQAWLIGGENALPKPLKSTGIPDDAVDLSDNVLDDQHLEDAEEIEASILAAQNCARCDAAWEVQYDGENLCHACRDKVVVAKEDRN